MPETGNINVNFVLEGEDAYECGQNLQIWIRELEKEKRVQLRHFRYEWFIKDSPQNRLSGTFVDKKEPSEAKQFEKNGRPIPVFQGGKDVDKT